MLENRAEFETEFILLATRAGKKQSNKSWLAEGEYAMGGGNEFVR